jgi:DnaJ-class molecular chaperone
MRFNRDCASTFHTNAEEERDLFFQAVQWVIEHPDEWSNENPGRETCTSQAKENSQDSANDYETLGIQADSSWSDVQAAYREICRKYHPDTLSGYKVPPHITELAIQRFKQATEAYRRLKSRIGVAD